MRNNKKTSDGSNRKILLLPVLIVLVTLGFYRHSIDSDNTSEELRSPASVVVPGALRTILKISTSDFDAATTAKVQKDLSDSITPQQLQHSSPQIIEKVKNGQMKFYLFKVFNSVSSSNDIIEISVDGLVYARVLLSNEEMTVSVPLEPEKSKIISVKAIQNGEAGITFGAKLVNSDILLKNIETNESEIIYIGFKKHE